jgi:hypothetical protein
VITSRYIRDEVKNVLDYLEDAEIARFNNPVSIYDSQEFSRVSWYGHNPSADFIVDRDYGTIAQYRHWLANGSYSALLLDASLLQITYDIRGGEIVGHRLAYIPCPFIVDTTLLDEGVPPDDVVGLYDQISDVALRSPIRFDYDIKAAKPRHPPSHLTINSSDCRIACVAPLHVQKFVDFIFRHFYPLLWIAHSDFFTASTSRHFGNQVLNEDDRATPHLMWNVHARAAG